MNHLEQLIIEWYEYQEYFVRKNVKVEKRSKGGYEGELDVVAFHPVKKHLIHIESSLDALSWEKREEKFNKKFKLGRKYIPGLFKGFSIPKEIDQVALLGFASKANWEMVGGGRIVLVKELIFEILTELRKFKVDSGFVAEQWPLIRTLHIVAHYRKEVIGALS